MLRGVNVNANVNANDEDDDSSSVVTIKNLIKNPPRRTDETIPSNIDDLDGLISDLVVHGKLSTTTIHCTYIVVL